MNSMENIHEVEWDNHDGSATPYSLELIERLNTKFDADWWHSGGGIMGIAIQHDGHFFFIGAADGTELGMDVEVIDGEWGFVGTADFGTIQANTPEVMANKIHDTITNQTWNRDVHGYWED